MASSRILDLAAPQSHLDRRRVMRYALGAVAGAVVLPVLAACGTAKPAANSSTPASSSAAAPPPVLLPTTGTSKWPVNVATAQPTAEYSMYATSGTADKQLIEMVTFGNDMWSTNDNFSYYGGKASGAGTFTAQVATLAPTDGWAKAGLMLRQTTDPDSPDLYFVTSVGNGASLQYRLTKGASAQGGPTVDPLAAYPIYLQMKYTPGKQVDLASSTDGKTWKNATTVPFVAADPKTKKVPTGAPANAILDPGITDPYYIGVCGCSHNAKLQGLVGFSNLTGFPTTGMAYKAVYNAASKSTW